MKKLILLLVILTIGFTSNAQNIRFGAKAGLNFSSITGDETEELDGRTSFHIGGVVEIEITEQFSIQPELLYSSQGSKSEYRYDDFGVTEGEYELKYNYINIPLNLKYYPIENLSIEAGPQVGFLLSAEGEWSESEYDNDNNLIYSESGTDKLKEFSKEVDFGLNFGLGYKLDNGINFSARYYLGLSNFEDGFWFDTNDDGSLKHNVFQISVGYFFN